MGDAAQTHVQFDEHMEDRKAHGRLFRLDNIEGFILVPPIPSVGRTARPDRQVLLLPRLPVAVRVFDDLVTLALGAPGQDGADKLASQAVIDVLADADDLAAAALNLFKDHRGVDEVAGKAPQVEDNNHIGQAVTDKSAGRW